MYTPQRSAKIMLDCDVQDLCGLLRSSLGICKRLGPSGMGPSSAEVQTYIIGGQSICLHMWRPGRRSLSQGLQDRTPLEARAYLSEQPCTQTLHLSGTCRSLRSFPGACRLTRVTKHYRILCRSDWPAVQVLTQACFVVYCSLDRSSMH